MECPNPTESVELKGDDVYSSAQAGDSVSLQKRSVYVGPILTGIASSDARLDSADVGEKYLLGFGEG